ncbi:MAG: leucine-rich repeat domain-containing protein [Alphaproteobacteria bacterium]|nr:leucine-rich repeat domain-containing protein [Alphaproteobacteria bacterium]
MNKLVLMNKIYVNIVLTILLVGNQGMCMEAPAGDEARSHASFHKIRAQQNYILTFLNKSDQNGFASVCRATREHIAKIRLSNAFRSAIRCIDPNLFCVVDGREIDRIASYPQWQMIGQEIPSFFKSALRSPILKDRIIAVKGSEFPLTVHGVFETKGEAEVLADTKGGHDAAHPPTFGYHSIPALNLFGGDSIVTTYATQGYTFWSQSELLDADDDKKATNRVQFQQSIGARYVFGTDIQEEGVLPAAEGLEEVLNALTPHVVLTTENLAVAEIRRRVSAFFTNANTAARGTSIPAASLYEDDEKTKTRLAAESKANAVAVIDVEAVNIGGVHELRLGHAWNAEEYPSILNEIRRLIVTTTSNEPLTIGDSFLYDCDGLTLVDLSLLEQVTTIKSFFLSGCGGLNSLDLRGLDNITAIGDCFLYNCTDLTFVDLNPLKNITATGNAFLGNCSSLISIDLKGLENITTIGNHFLMYCTGLISLDLSLLRSIKTIGGGFLYFCEALTSLNVIPLRNVTAIGGSFLSSCINLRTIKGFSHWVNIDSIGSTFLSDTDKLSIEPDFDGAPVPDLMRLRLRGEAAVTEIQRVVAAAQAGRLASLANG